MAEDFDRARLRAEIEVLAEDIKSTKQNYSRHVLAQNYCKELRRIFSTSKKGASMDQQNLRDALEYVEWLDELQDLSNRAAGILQRIHEEVDSAWESTFH